MKNKLVIITGASSGIGKACAEKFAQEGANLVLAARSADKLREVAENIARYGVQVLPVVTDVSVEEECKHLIKSAINKFGRIDVLVNNAGISMRASFTDLDTSVLKKVMDVNFWGTIYCTRYAISSIIENKGYGEMFNHSTGHGIGLEVHTLPRVHKNNHALLKKNNVITIEPGIYIPDWGGVRIEDDCLILDSTCQPLNESTKELIIV